MTVVRDDPHLIALWMPSGTPWLRPVGPDGLPMRLPTHPWRLVEQVWHNEVLFLAPPEAAHTVWVMWSDSFERFLGWYVNLQEPLRRTPDGFEYMDQELDLVVSPDRTWRWKDEQDQAEAVRRGLRTTAEAAAVREEGRRMVAEIESWSSPFGDGWERWRPPGAWPRPSLGAIERPSTP